MISYLGTLATPGFAPGFRLQVREAAGSRSNPPPGAAAPAARPAPAKAGARAEEKPSLIHPPAGGLKATDAEFRRLYGPGVYVMDALADINVGDIRGVTYVAAHRFRATAGGRPTSLRIYWPAGAGYSSGDGGTVSIRILPDDGTAANLPDLSARPLATGLYSPRLVMGRHVLSSFNDEVRLGSIAPLVPGNLYHVVYQNVAPDPASNWIGVNNIVTVERNGRPARWLDPTDWAVLFGYRPVGSNAQFTWKDASRATNSGLYYAPILQIGLDNGTYLGAADIEAGNTEGERQTSASNDQPVRERFNPSASRTVWGFSVNTATTTGGELEWSVLRGDVVLAAGTIVEPKANYSNQVNIDVVQGVFKWYDVPLPGALTLEAGGTYDLMFRPKGDSQWRFASEYNGANRKFNVAFSESQAQRFAGGKWTNTTHRMHVGTNPTANWRVVFHAAP